MVERGLGSREGAIATRASLARTVSGAGLILEMASRREFFVISKNAESGLAALELQLQLSQVS